jgi:hypothetical protein
MKTKKALRKLLILSENYSNYGWEYTYYLPHLKEFDYWGVSKSGEWYTDSWNNNPDRVECAYEGIQLYLKTVGVKLK